MSVVNGTRSAAETRGGATSASQAQRLQWEQQWLRANRDVQRVVRNDERAATPEQPALAVLNIPKAEPGFAAVLPRQPEPVPAAVSIAAQHAMSAPAALAGVAPAALRADALAAANVWQPTELDVPSRVAAGADSRTAGPMAREKLKQFAFWHDEKKVGVALRLPDTANSGSVIGQLRKWLRDAGLTLMNVVINGSVRWRHERPPRDGF